MDTNQIEPQSQPAADRGLITHLVDQIIRAINEANELAALERVANLRAAQPEASPDALADQLIRQKCLQAGAPLIERIELL